MSLKIIRLLLLLTLVLAQPGISLSGLQVRRKLLQMSHFQDECYATDSAQLSNSKGRKKTKQGQVADLTSFILKLQFKKI